MKVYFPLIDFSIEHGYFSDRKSRDIDLFIAKNEKRLLNNYKLIFKRVNSSHYVLFADCNENIDERISMLEQDMLDDENLLSFILKVNNNRLFTVTKNVSISMGKEMYKVTVLVESENNEPINIDLTGWGKTTGENSFEKDLLKALHPSLAIISFRTSDIQSGFSFLERIKSLRTLKINITLEPKSVYWRFLLFPRANKESDVSVVDACQKVTFSNVGWKKLENEQLVGESFSEEEITLAESYPFQMQLWKNYLNGKVLVNSQLSCPNPENPGNFIKSDNEKNYITIYQYF